MPTSRSEDDGHLRVVLARGWLAALALLLMALVATPASALTTTTPASALTTARSAALLAATPGAGAGLAATKPREVLVTRLATAITPVIADHVREGLEEAAAGGYAAYVIELDTPGGLATAMRDIVTNILASPVPVVVYVSPDGARAGSAGAIISFAAHVLVMAPSTTIGAATPIGLQGEEVPAKVVNDAAAQAEALADLRGRDKGFIVDTVRKGRSATVDEALRLKVADARATTLAGALEEADGRSVTVAGQRTVTVETAGAQVVRRDLGVVRKVLQFLADPNIAFLLLTLGTLGLLYELASPSAIAGTIGATCLLLALFSLSVLPVNAVGVLLLLLSAALFVAELLAPGTAGFAFGGAVVLVLAGFFLFDSSQGLSVGLGTLLPVTVLMLVLTVLAGRVAYRVRHQPSRSTGADVLTGRVVSVTEADGVAGRAFAEGTWWTVRSAGPLLVAGSRARVVGMSGLDLVVEPEPGADTPTPEKEETS
jgi:membrane-bound serine protease (ClpP class)